MATYRAAIAAKNSLNSSIWVFFNVYSQKEEEIPFPPKVEWSGRFLDFIFFFLNDQMLGKSGVFPCEKPTPVGLILIPRTQILS